MALLRADQVTKSTINHLAEGIKRPFAVGPAWRAATGGLPRAEGSIGLLLQTLMAIEYLNTKVVALRGHEGGRRLLGC